MPPALHSDQVLTAQHIQALTSADRLAEFFAYLGYPEGTRLPMTPEALQLPQALTDAVRHSERLTSVAGALEVYLFELTSVTMAHTQALARAFRNRVGNFLLVLTADYSDDYRRLDFVLLERELPDTATGQVRIRPNVLSLDRRAPDRVALRVLRRFSFTASDETGAPDPYAQFDKLRSAYAVAAWAEPLFNNRALFSDYYLNERLPDLDVWDAPDRNRAFRAIRRVWSQARRVLRQDPATAREGLVGPVLEALGFNLTPPAPLSESSERGENAPNRVILSAAEGSPPLAVALAYPWGRYLDGKDAHDPAHPEENPGAQVLRLLDAEDAPAWAIVTNGKLWRLYSARAHSRATNYYEIDLEETLAAADPAEPFRYFYLFFRAAAFAPDPAREGQSFLDWLLEESATYARELGARLKTRVFEQIFPHFAEGFIAGMGGPEALLALSEAERAQRLDAVFQGTLTFLYRLLVLLYAESRDLLPVREARGYGEISLQRLKEEVAKKAGPLEDLVPQRLAEAYPLQLHTPPSPFGGGAGGGGGCGLYSRLLALFAVIDRGSAAHNVPTYNGGLFQTAPRPTDEGREAAAARFLQATPMPDYYLALGLDRLTRDIDPKRGDLGFIDYKSLGVRQLGSIYEGLLEFKLRLNPQSSILNPQSLTLTSDKGERKATGSYYTPDYIVHYIVRHTVGPVLDEHLAALAPRLREAAQRFHRAVRHKREVEGVAQPDEPALLQDMAGDVLRDLFDLKILDPAMGSGHFLVEAVDYVTDRLVRFLDGFPFLGTFFAGMRASILAAMARQGVTVDAARLTDVTLLKRHVLKRCIYGVDLNPMAVELAKVSLWLDCFTLGAPLSFLDHHLRCGNSLIGTLAREVAEGFEDAMPLFGAGPFSGLLRAAETIQQISANTDVTLDQVQESRSLYHIFEAEATPYKRLLDIHVARHFDVARADEFLRVYDPAQALAIIKGEADEVPAVYRALIPQVRALYDKKRFFHWDLEFPEVFIDLGRATWKEDGGFDAVIGNPPYVRQEVNEDKNYFSSIYESYSGRADIYVYFLEKEVSLICPEGQLGIIVSNKFTQVNYGIPIREMLTTKTSPKIVLNFSDLPIFEDVTAYPLILVTKRETPDSSESVAYSDVTTLAGFPDTLALSEILIEDFQWHARLDFDRDLSSICMSLTKYTEKPLVGIKTGANDAFIMDTEVFDELSQQFLRPYLFGRNIGPYKIISPLPRIIFPYSRKDNRYIPVAPPVGCQARKQLEENSQQLKSRAIIREKYPAGLCEWFEYQQINHQIDYKDPKIVFPNVADGPSFALDRSGSLVDMTAFIIPTSDMYLLSLLNSTLLFCFFAQDAVQRRGGYFEWKVQYVEKLPIRRIHFTTPTAERERRVAELVARYERDAHEALLAEVAALLPQDTDGNFLAFQPGATGAEEQSDVVHDLLAHLAEAMIAMHEQKQARVATFWDALKSATDSATFEVLRNKGKWERSLAKAPACRPYVDADSRSTRHLDESLGWDAACFTAFARMLVGKTSVTPAMEAVYAEHQGAYRALVARIAATDRLIDAVVYRLYGLTAEEVAVVEEG